MRRGSTATASWRWTMTTVACRRTTSRRFETRSWRVTTRCDATRASAASTSRAPRTQRHSPGSTCAEEAAWTCSCRRAGAQTAEPSRCRASVAVTTTIPLTAEQDAAIAVDTELLRSLERRWKDVVAAIFEKTPESGGSSGFFLEYIGCVVARPGDEHQNWHLDGVHRNLQQHEPADRLNVFVPLVDLTPDVGGTEMKKASQFHDNGRRGAAFADYAHLESVTPMVTAGTPVLMDYRVCTEGSRIDPSARDRCCVKREQQETTPKKKKKKRIALVQVS
ncbi:hypothetical protein PINS_up008469 [Pythium insidiosum]|nr:hypothetical protein PINS_up008469 [Pythium insidiosum]